MVTHGHFRRIKSTPGELGAVLVWEAVEEEAELVLKNVHRGLYIYWKSEHTAKDAKKQIFPEGSVGSILFDQDADIPMDRIQMMVWTKSRELGVQLGIDIVQAAGGILVSWRPL